MITYGGNPSVPGLVSMFVFDLCVCGLVCVFAYPDLRGSVVEGDKSRGGVGQDVEVGGGGRTHGERAALRVHLVVHQTPLLQERMHPRVGETPKRKR